MASGAEGSRTLDLLNAIQALSQLSYGPTGGKRAESRVCSEWHSTGQRVSECESCGGGRLDPAQTPVLEALVNRGDARQRLERGWRSIPRRPIRRRRLGGSEDHWL